VSKIRDAQASLDERIAELEDALEDAQSKLATLKRLTDRIHDVGARAQVEEILDEEALAA
jgi:hypothetical protein